MELDGAVADTLFNREGQQVGVKMPTEPVLPADELRMRVMQRLETTRLPILLSLRIDAGYGSGASCALCDLAIAGDKIEYDVTDPRTNKRLHFHYACHAAWQRECALRLRYVLSASTEG